ncbi:type IV secretory system conjugative DNA transfer family protein [Vibrio parahaemolyticus]|nr:type IV secretory system conjugative DNA transfer family protein [Vibrio parahaemolyticus]EHH2462803.1 type IV secretory system conjugative DNA transfer family protein [Vibrio parahaemolyticus]EJG1580759.1 type IV secretory system conjugative DNA transfer family protein [Vibrio parahaemolyticus]
MSRLILMAAYYGSPIIIWFVTRAIAGSIAEGTTFYGAAITSGPLFLFLAVFFLYRGRVLPMGVYYASIVGCIISGLYGFWKEYLRWQPTPGQYPYDLQIIISNLDYPLILVSFICIATSIFALFSSSETYQKLRLKAKNKNLQGSAKWMSISDAKTHLSTGSLVIGEAYEPAKNVSAAGSSTLLNFDGSGHLITVAGSGSGKTISVAIPNTLNWKENLVVHDPKGELYHQCANARKAKGQRVVSLDPNNTESESINVLDWVDTTSPECIEDVQALISWLNPGEKSSGDNSYFEQEGEKLLQTLLLHVLFCPEISDGNKNLRMLRRLISSGKVPMVLEDITDRGSDYGYGVPAQYATELLSISKEAEKQWAGILGYASNITSWLTQPNLAALVSGSDSSNSNCSLNDLATGQVDFFINVPLKTLDATAAPARLIIGSLLNIKYEHMKKRPGEKPRKTLFLLDEMPRLKNMEILETARDAGRGAGIVLWSIIQDLGQLERYYETHGSRSWLENAQVKTFFGVTDLDTAKLLSEMLGNETVLSASFNESQQQSFSSGGNSGSTYQTISKPLMTPDEIMNMAVDEKGIPDEQLVFVRNREPLRCGMAKYFRRPEFNELVTR